MFFVVERNFARSTFMPRGLSNVDAGRKRRQSFEAEKVEFDEAGRLDPFHVELGRRHVGFGIAIERHQFVERPVADDDARRMGRGVGVKPFELLRDCQHLF